MKLRSLILSAVLPAAASAAPMQLADYKWEQKLCNTANKEIL